MEHFAVVVVEWLGRIIAQKLAGSALQEVWRRFSPLFKDLLTSASFWRKKATENSKAVDSITQDIEEALALLRTADTQLARLLSRNELLQAENQDLKARLAQYEPR